MSEISKENEGRQELAGNVNAATEPMRCGRAVENPAGGPTTASSAAQDHEGSRQEPYYRVELRIHCVGEGGAIPLGNCLDDGEWSPCEFVAATALGEMAPLDVANWLAGIDLMGMPVFDSVEEALAAVMDTRQRCLLACRSADDYHAVKEADAEQPAGGPLSR